MATLSLGALLGAATSSFAVTPGMFDPRDPNSLTRNGQTQQKPCALTGSRRSAREQNNAHVQVNTETGARAVIATYPNDKR